MCLHVFCTQVQDYGRSGRVHGSVLSRNPILQLSTDKHHHWSGANRVLTLKCSRGLHYCSHSGPLQTATVHSQCLSWRCAQVLEIGILDTQRLNSLSYVRMYVCMSVTLNLMSKHWARVCFLYCHELSTTSIVIYTLWVMHVGLPMIMVLNLFDPASHSFALSALVLNWIGQGSSP